MDMIDKYVIAIGKNLPRNLRQDIEGEIRSTLQDMLDDRSKAENRPIDEGMIKEVIGSYGDPEQVAAAYMPERYLIGPRLYPLFTLVLKIVFTVLAVLALVGLAILAGSSPFTPQSFLMTVGKSVFQFYSGAIIAFGNIVIIFAIIEWSMRPTKLKEGRRAWDPDKLLAAPDPEEVGMWEPIWTIFFSILAIVIFNFYPQLVGLNFTANSSWFLGLGVSSVNISVLSPTFFSYLTWLNLLWCLTILLNILLLRRRRWQAATRWFAIGIRIAGIVLALVMLMGPSLIGITTPVLVQAGNMTYEAAGLLVSLFNQVARIILVLSIVLGGIDVVRSLYRLFRPKPASPLPAKS